MATSARLDELKKKFDENPRRYFAPLANEYRKLGDLTQAIALCRAHLPNQSGHISGHIVLAQALYEARELDESRQIFEAALELDPENLIALRFLGDIAREQDEPWQARGWYERVLEADPRNEEIALMLRDLDARSTETSDDAFDPGPSDPAIAAAEPAGYESRTMSAPPALAWSTDLTSHQAPVESGGELANFAIPGSSDAPSPSDVAPVHAESGDASRRSAVESPVEFPEPDAILHDLPAGDASLSYFEGTTSDEEYLTVPESGPDDSFFDSAQPTESVPHRSSDADAESREDDWFSSHVEKGEVAASPADEGQAPEPFEDSFLPDFQLSPGFDAGTIARASDLEAAPGYFDDSTASDSDQRDEADSDWVGSADAVAAGEATSLFTSPTPSFLRSVASDDTTDDAQGGDAEHDAPSDHEDGAYTMASHVSRATHDIAVTAEGDDAEDAEFELAAFAEYSPDDPNPAAALAGEGAPNDEPTLDVEVIAETTEPIAGAEVSTSTSGDHESDDELWESAFAPTTDEPDELEADAADLWSAEADGGDSPPLADADIEVEFEDFSVPLAHDSVDEHAAETAVVSSAEPVVASDDEADGEAAVESQAATTGEPVEVHHEGDREWDAAQSVAPIEGLVTRDVSFETVAASDDEMSDLETASDLAPAFVTETMAELYLQQGFHDEALAIYRQLLAQHPDDPALHDRVAAIERGASSTVVEGIVPRDTIDREGQSVRQFFAHFARREPRPRGADERDSGASQLRAAADAQAELSGTTAGIANADEALTVPDHDLDVPSSPSGAASLTQLFATGVVSGSDEVAAASLASAFGGHDAPQASRTAERELSLEHLFRDVPSRSPGAVTLDEFFHGASPGDDSPASSLSADGEERGADIEQFTAWLEGLKKK